LVRFREAGQVEGRVIRLLGDLEDQGRMARALVSVADPLGRNRDDDAFAPLLLGQFVHVDIEGRRLSRVARIPRAALRNGERVWIVDDEGRLRFRRVEVVWREKDSFLVRGDLVEGDRLVVSEVAVPAEGMMLEVVTEAAAPPAGEEMVLERGHGG